VAQLMAFRSNAGSHGGGMTVVVPLLLDADPLLEELDVDPLLLEELSPLLLLLEVPLFFLPESTTSSSSPAMAPASGTSSNEISNVHPATKKIVAAVLSESTSAGRICAQA
jgi:hypothetical protein